MYPRGPHYRFPVEALDQARYVGEFLNLIGVPPYCTNFYPEDISIAEFQAVDWPYLYHVLGFHPLHCDIVAHALYELRQYRKYKHSHPQSFKQKVSEVFDTIRRNKHAPHWHRANPLEDETLLQEIQRMPRPETHHVTYSGNLYAAIMTGNEEWAKERLQRGEFVNEKNRQGWTPLMLASYVGSEGIVRMLMTAGARVDLQNKNGENAFIIAANWGHSKIIERLYTSVPRQLQFTVMSPVHLVGKGARNALHHATRHRQLECIRVLLEMGADPNKPDYEGMTPTLMAASAGYGDSLRMLVRKGGDMKRKNKSGQDGYALWPYDPERLQAELRVLPRVMHASS